MDTFDTIRARRSVKHYDPQHEMTEAEEKELLELAMLSPTAFNIQHWRFVAVRDPALRMQIQEAAWNQAQVTESSLIVILAADKLAWKKSPERYWANAPQQVQDLLVPAIGQYYTDNEEAQRDECMRSCGMAGQTIMLAAKAMGYDTCPMDGFDFEKVAKLINLPSDHIISFMIAIGKVAKQPWARPGQLSYDEVVIRDRF